jgi:hypothetical protein
MEKIVAEVHQLLNVNQREFIQYLIQLNVMLIINVIKVYEQN